MEGLKQEKNMESLHVESLIWSQGDDKSQMVQQNINPFQIYTVSKCIKNPFILQHIKPDYGSLGEFMTDVGISKDILLHNRKKKQDQQEDLEQKRMRNTLKDKNLEQILRSESSTVLQKSIASKMIIEGLFQKNFGVPLQTFCSQNSKSDNNKGNYSNLSTLQVILNEILEKRREDLVPHFIQNQSIKNESVATQKNKTYLSYKDLFVHSTREKLKIINELKNKYKNLKKYELNDENWNTNSKDDKRHPQQFKDYYPQSFKSLKGDASDKSQVLNFENSILNFSALIEKLKVTEFEKIALLKLSSISVTDDVFCFLIDIFCRFGHSLKEIIVEKIKFISTQKVALKIKELLQTNKIKKLSLQGLNLSSKDFCLVCLGVGNRDGMEQLGLKDNSIGEVAKKCLDVLMKFKKQLLFDLRGNPIEKQLKDKSTYWRCFPNLWLKK